MTPNKMTRIALLIAQIIGGFGVARAAQPELGHLEWVGYLAAAINSLVTIGHALWPSLVPAQQPTNPDSGGGNTLGKAAILLLALLLIPATLKAQTIPEAPAPQVQNLYAGGVSFNPGGSPQIAGNVLYAHRLNESGTYTFSDIDLIPNTVRPFTVTTNVGVGVAQKIADFGKFQLWIPTGAGVSVNGSNTGWQWNGGAALVTRVKENWFLLPNVRFLKSSVSNGTGYQVIAGIDIGFGK